MKSFKETIGGTAEKISEARVQRTVQNTAEYSSKYIDDLKHSFRDMQSKIEDHMDIAPTNTTDIASNLRNFNEKKWIDELYPMIFKIAQLSINIRIAVNAHNKLFPEDTKTGLTKLDADFIEDLSGVKVDTTTNNPA